MSLYFTLRLLPTKSNDEDEDEGYRDDEGNLSVIRSMKEIRSFADVLSRTIPTSPSFPLQGDGDVPFSPKKGRICIKLNLWFLELLARNDVVQSACFGEFFADDELDGKEDSTFAEECTSIVADDGNHPSKFLLAPHEKTYLTLKKKPHSWSQIVQPNETLCWIFEVQGFVSFKVVCVELDGTDGEDGDVVQEIKNARGGVTYASHYSNETRAPLHTTLMFMPTSLFMSTPLQLSCTTVLTESFETAQQVVKEEGNQKKRVGGSKILRALVEREGGVGGEIEVKTFDGVVEEEVDKREEENEEENGGKEENLIAEDEQKPLITKIWSALTSPSASVTSAEVPHQPTELLRLEKSHEVDKNEMKARITHLEQQLATEIYYNTRREEEAENFVCHCVAYKGDINKLKDEAVEAKRTSNLEIARLQNVIRRLEEEKEKTRGDIDGLKGSLEKLMGEGEAKGSKYEKVKGERRIIKDEVKELRSEITRLESQVRYFERVSLEEEKFDRMMTGAHFEEARESSAVAITLQIKKLIERREKLKGLIGGGSGGGEEMKRVLLEIEKAVEALRGRRREVEEGNGEAHAHLSEV